MRCPVCNMELQLAERQGIEIDYCPQCRGVWLDRGELEKIIERTLGVGAANPPVAGRTISLDKPKRSQATDQKITIEDDYRGQVLRQRYQSRQRTEHDDDRDSRKKKGNAINEFLGDLFDFD